MAKKNICKKFGRKALPVVLSLTMSVSLLNTAVYAVEGEPVDDDVDSGFNDNPLLGYDGPYDFDDINIVEGETTKDKDIVTKGETVEIGKDKPALPEGYDPDEWEYVPNGSTTTTQTGEKTQHSETTYEYEVTEETKEVWEEVDVVTTYETTYEIMEERKVGEEPVYRTETTTTCTNEVDLDKSKVIENEKYKDVTGTDFLVFKKGGNVFVWANQPLTTEQEKAMLKTLGKGLNGGKATFLDPKETNITDLADTAEGLNIYYENDKLIVEIDKNSQYSKWAYGKFGYDVTETQVPTGEVKDVYEYFGTGEFKTEIREEVTGTEWVKKYVTEKTLNIKPNTKEWQEWEEWEQTMYEWILQPKAKPPQPPIVTPDPPQPPVINIPDEQPPLVDLPDEEPPLVELPDEEVPLEETPVIEIPEEDVPLADIPEEDVPLADIPEEDVPLSDIPKTGDPMLLWAMASAISGAGLLGLTLKRKKDEA